MWIVVSDCIKLRFVFGIDLADRIANSHAGAGILSGKQDSKGGA